LVIRKELSRLDVAMYEAVAATSTPRLDRAMSGLSSAADYSRLSLAAAVVLAAAGGVPGRRAAVRGVAAVALTAAVVNGLVKPLARRRRPQPPAGIPLARRVRMPRSASFPSGHSASAFAFAAEVGRELPWAGVALTALATTVAYSRVHTGVHYPGDVVAGALCGLLGAAASDHLLERAAPAPAREGRPSW
jgi:undecaprenyl-diphosphatase